ncbi:MULTISPECIES: hypothetical protein [Moorena]|nr:MULTISPECIES: hypothetical protein [Moorena]NEP35058.1 hypothetical protein [Moorena sp. SIO3B2]NEP70142.1 hypothetical protein [Moorena sp. SIO3A5]NES41316.1 hypothetical protein [Moorena sp. SIO2C4]NET66714.1 hypothetical protein [Moorena sp. SIO1G6]
MKYLLGALSVGEFNSPRVAPLDAVAHGENPHDTTALLLSKASKKMGLP